MNMTEYNRVKAMTYEEYCDYLQGKYGVGLTDYMTKALNPNPKCKRTKEGLFAHHKAEDKMIMLSTKEYAAMMPFEWQKKENIVYCDFLEHLLLHVKICQWPSSEAIPGFDVGIGGVVNFIVPELNDLYSGWVTGQAWRKNVHAKVINDKEVYIEILRQFIEWAKANRKDVKPENLHTSFNEPYGTWSRLQNRELFHDIDKLWD